MVHEWVKGWVGTWEKYLQQVFQVHPFKMPNSLFFVKNKNIFANTQRLA